MTVWSWMVFLCWMQSQHIRNAVSPGWPYHMLVSQQAYIEGLERRIEVLERCPPPHLHVNILDGRVIPPRK